MQKEQEAAQLNARVEMMDKRNQLRNELVANQQKEFLELVANSGSLTSADLIEKKEELQRQHKVGGEWMSWNNEWSSCN